MTASKARRRHRPSLEVDFNGTPRHIASSPSATSGSDDDADGERSSVCADGPGRGVSSSSSSSRHITGREWGNMALLVLLYAMQGIPLGLTMGAMPFLLQSKLSMTQMGLFSISSYPYSFKLLWSPIVDSVYSAAFGRRKSWIVPVQLASAWLLIASAGWIQAQYEAGGVGPLTCLFFFFVLLAATQDIAVDGWALTLLPPHHIEYASTCQTLGMNSGYFTSFTVFLALSNAEFADKYVRRNELLAGLFGLEPNGQPLVSLRGYVLFWGWTFTAVTLAIALLKQEAAEYDAGAASVQQRRRKRQQQQQRQQEKVAKGGGASSGGRIDWSTRVVEIRRAYHKLWGVVCLRPIWGLSFLLLSYRLGVLPAESASALKLLDKGVAKEALAALVLVQFPVELVSAVIAGRWASSHSPYHPFMAGYFVRLTMCVALTALARAFPPGASSFVEHSAWFGALSAIGLVTSFSSTLMFTALGSFFNRISDPGMGGAYLTLLNTIANMGVILPKTPLFAAMDLLTVSSCRDKDGGRLAGFTCPKKLRELMGSNACTDAGFTCSLDSDGFYLVSYSMIVVGLGLGCVFMSLFPRLDRLPLERWRAKH